MEVLLRQEPSNIAFTSRVVPASIAAHISKIVAFVPTPKLSPSWA